MNACETLSTTITYVPDERNSANALATDTGQRTNADGRSLFSYALSSVGFFQWPFAAIRDEIDPRSTVGPAVTSSLRVVRHEALRRPGVPSVRFPVFPRYRGHLGNGARARRGIETPRLKSRPGHVVCPTAGGVTAMFIGKTAVGRAPAGGPSGVCSVLSESAVKRPTFSRHSYDGSTGTQRLCY